MKIYTLKTCDSCRKATRWLNEHSLEYQEIPIRENPPNREELHLALQTSPSLRALFNASGKDYRSLDLKSKLPSMSEDETLALLTSNGNLVKRPLLVTKTQAICGFNPEKWTETLL